MTIRERGSALVEAGLAIPLLFLLFAGAADFGRIFWRCNETISAARDGAQVAMNAYPTFATADADKQITAAIQNDSAMTGLAGVVSRFYTCPDNSGDDTRSLQHATAQACPGERIYVKIVASAPFTAVTPHPKILYPSTVHSTAVVRVQ